MNDVLAPEFLLRRCRQKEIQPELLGEIAGGELAFDAVAGIVEPGSEGAHPTFAGSNGDDPATDATLPGQSNIEEPVAGGFVETGGRHHCQHPFAGLGVDDAVASDRVDATVGEGRAHDRQIARGHV